MESIVLLIIIAVISTLFKNSKGRPSNRRTIPEFKRELQETYREIVNMDVPDKKAELEKRRQQVHKQEERLRETIAASGIEKARMQGQETIQTGRRHNGMITPEPVEEETPAIAENNLADAVIWAEILGPPRAKKPYYRK